jgi:hypothetical protein
MARAKSSVKVESLLRVRAPWYLEMRHADDDFRQINSDRLLDVQACPEAEKARGL